MWVCCFGLSLQNASIFIAIIDIVGGLFGVISTLLFSVVVLIFPDKLEEWFDIHLNSTASSAALEDGGVSGLVYNATNRTYEELDKFLEQPFGLQVGILAFLLILCLLELGLAILLLKGAKERLMNKCNLWFKIKLALFVVGILFCIGAIITSQERIHLGITSGIAFLYQVWCLMVVKAYISEIQGGSYRRANCGPPQEEEMNKL